MNARGRKKVVMENYIIRIYRRDPNSPGKIVGIIEEVGGSEKRVFKNFDELWLTLVFPNMDLPKAQEEGKEKDAISPTSTPD